jgi:hypothetical protein
MFRVMWAEGQTQNLMISYVSRAAFLMLLAMFMTLSSHKWEW